MNETQQGGEKRRHLYEAFKQGAVKSWKSSVKSAEQMARELGGTSRAAATTRGEAEPPAPAPGLRPNWRSGCARPMPPRAAPTAARASPDSWATPGWRD